MKRIAMAFGACFIAFILAYNVSYVCADEMSPGPPRINKANGQERISIDDIMELSDTQDIPAEGTILNAESSAIDRPEIQPLVMTEPVWKPLERMPLDEKNNAILQLELESNASAEALQMAARIENHWNTGDFAEALALFPELETLTNIDDMAIVNAWRTPLQSNDISLWGSDVRIGLRDSVYITSLDIHRASGNLFAILLYQGDGWGSQISVNISTDNGITWAEPMRLMATYQINYTSASVVANHCYTAYTCTPEQDEVRIRRNKFHNGYMDTLGNGSYSEVIFSTTLPEYIEEIKLVSNQDFESTTYHRLYLTAITSADNLKYYWDDENASSWSETSTGVTNAENGLSSVINVGYEDYWFFTSYIDNNNNLQIDGYDSGSWTNLFSQPVGVPPRHTSISGYDDIIYCLFEYSGSTNHCRYRVSYDGGSNWYWNVVDDTTNTSECPAVAARFDGGVGMIWRYYSMPREGHYVWRDYTGIWPAPETYTDHPPYYNPPSMEYIGNGRYGVVYTCWNTPHIRAAYFDTHVEGGYDYLPGDVNMFNGLWPPMVIGGDVTYLVNYFKGSSSSHPCWPGVPFWCSADANGDCIVMGSDVIRLVAYFRGAGVIQFCPDYPPNYPPLPGSAPPGWPNCMP